MCVCGGGGGGGGLSCNCSEPCFGRIMKLFNFMQIINWRKCGVLMVSVLDSWAQLFKTLLP